jgi:hypothetical protein
MAAPYSTLAAVHYADLLVLQGIMWLLLFVAKQHHFPELRFPSVFEEL